PRVSDDPCPIRMPTEKFPDMRFRSEGDVPPIIVRAGDPGGLRSPPSMEMPLMFCFPVDPEASVPKKQPDTALLEPSSIAMPTKPVPLPQPFTTRPRMRFDEDRRVRQNPPAKAPPVNSTRRTALSP